MDITPTAPVTLSGYSSRTNVSQGVHDPLSARVVAFEQEGRRLVLISLDNIGFYGGVDEPLRQAIAEAGQLKPSEIFLCAIHTHSAPTLTLDSNTGHSNNVAYTAALQANLSALVRETLSHLEPIALGFGAGASPVGANRREATRDETGQPKVVLGRNPAVLTDREVQVLTLTRSASNELAAVLFAYATHSTSLGPRNYLISGDVHGTAEQFLERYLGGGVVAPAFAGASGNVDPWVRVLPEFKTAHGWVPEPILMGTMLGEEVARVAEGIKEAGTNGPVRTLFKTVDLPGKLKGTNGVTGAGLVSPLNLTVGRVGEVAFVGLGGEVFNEIGNAIKTASPFPHTVIMTHCNGAAGYLPTRASYAEGGYEVQSSAFAAGADALVVDEARRMLDELWQKPEAAPSTELAYRDASQPLERRVEDLLGRMTLEEKVGQMNMPCVYESGLGNSIAQKTAAVQKFTLGTYVKGLGPGGGFFTLPNTILHEGPRQQAEFLNQLQHLALEKTRLGIPLLETEEGTHGLMCPGGTVFPEGPGLGSTWNLEVLAKVYGIVAREARSIGVHQNFTLVIEPIRDPRLGRNQEAFAEDPFLCSRIAETIVRSMQGSNLAAPDKVVSGLCHYPGQSQPVSGFERGAMEISERMLREVFLPSWRAGIQGCGALGVMATYPAIDAMPTHASEKILTRILRQEFGFDGLVLSEGGGIGTLVYEGLAPSQKEAGALALAAGLDVGISYESGYMGDLIANVQEGKVPMSLVDRAVRRILKQKFRLGLFEQPFVDADRAVAVVHQPAHQAVALEAARESLVLLKNERNALPLRKTLRSVAVIGPNADDPRNQLGDYAPARVPQHVISVFEGIKQVVSAETKVAYVKGCGVVGTNLNEIGKARAAAAQAEVAIVVVGENEWRAPGHTGTDGEGYDAATLELTGLQEELVKAVQGTGTPTVVVLVNGRPLATRWIAQHVPAVLEAWLPGEKGGQAVAEALFGDLNPSGHLSVTVPRHAGQLPVYYNAKKSKRYWVTSGWGKPYVDLEPTPLYPFGHGLSYTRFEYAGLKMSARTMGPADSLEIEVTVKNTGDRAGAEVVQLYLEDVISSVATPVKELRGFAKIALQPGEMKTCQFKLTPDDLALYDVNLRRVVEPGQFRVMVGASSEDIRLRGEFTVTDNRSEVH